MLAETIVIGIVYQVRSVYKRGAAVIFKNIGDDYDTLLVEKNENDNWGY